MSFALRVDRSIADEVRRIATEQLEKAIEDLGRIEEDPHEAIHEMRKRAKKLRALLRLVRDAAPEIYQRENAVLRDAAREISALRDRAALVESTDLMLAESLDPAEAEALRTLRAHLSERCETVEHEPPHPAARVQETLGLALERARHWDLRDLDAAGLVDGAARTYARGRAGLARARKSRDAHDFHDWRKRAKYSRHHHELLEPVWPEMMSAWRDAFKTLSDRLGDHHDLAVLRHALDGAALDRGLQAAALATIERQRRSLEVACLDLGQRLYAEKTRAFARRLAAWVDASTGC